ncbi:MAG: DoxX family protein [Rhodospirillaceae bacterium]|nr:DoxX family protein [Rhodospirillaceae bacterium]
MPAGPSTIARLAGRAIGVQRQAVSLLDRFAAPAADLAVRIMIGLVFFNSGRQKLQDWESTVFLFAEEYKVPLLTPEAAAWLGTTFEVTMPLLLFVGLAARLAALPLLGMALVIQFVLGASNPAYDSMEHFYWMILLLLIVVRGPGMLSLDHVIKRRFANGPGAP